MRSCLLFLSLSFMIFARPGWAQVGAPAVKLSDTTRFVPVGRQVDILEDKTAQLTFGQVQNHHGFQRSPSEKFQYGFSSYAYWFRFKLTNQNHENQKHWLLGLLEATSLDFADLYIVYPGGRVMHQQGGIKRGYVDQGFFSATPFFRVTLPVNQTVTVYMRIQSSLAMFGRVSVWDEYYNLSKGRMIIFAIWMFLGLFIVRSLTNFVLGRFIPDRQFRFYAGCTFLLYVSTLSRTGIYPMLFANYPGLVEWMQYGMGRLLPLGLAAWMYTLLDKRPAYRPFRLVLIGIEILSVVGVIMPFVLQTAAVGQFFATLVLLMYGLFLGGVILTWWQGPHPPLHLLLPITGCMLPFIGFQLQTLSLIPYTPVIGNLVMMALAIEMISMSLVLGRIVQSYINERIHTANALTLEKMEVDKLHELDMLKTQFYTNVSHELRTPLTLLLGPLADLRREFADRPVLVMMERNGHRLLTLINQLLDLSRLDVGQLKAVPEPTELTVFFQLIASSFESLAESRHISFSFDQPDGNYWAFIDRDKLDKITMNLLANAIKFTPSGGTVTMKIRYTDQQPTGLLILSVSDTGIGISPIHLPRIFDRFYQQPAEANSRRIHEGTGIGLALVSELAKVLGGSVTVASVEGTGSTFTLRLPINSTIAPATEIDQVKPDFAPELPFPPVKEGNSNSLRLITQTDEPDSAQENVLLIIDDNADIRAYVRSIFEPDYQIVEAEDGQQGLEKATQITPDLVICDLMMPQIDGYGFCKELKEQPATSHIPVIMLTAKATLEDRIGGFEIGADEYLTKPFNRAELEARVRNLLAQRVRLRHWLTRHWSSDAPSASPADSSQTTEEAVGQPTLMISETIFLDRLTKVVQERLNDPEFTVDALAQAVNLSRSQLHRKLRAVANRSATEFIRDARLSRAAQLLRSGDQSVTQIAYEVGFDNLSYFARIFGERFGMPPSQYSKASSEASVTSTS